MAPTSKRKRNERVSTDSADGGSRPSPHRPGNSNLAREDNRQEGGGGRGQRRSTGGRNNNGPRRNNNNERRNSHSQDVNSIPVTARTPTTPGPMSPPIIPSISRAQTPTPSTPAAEPSPEAVKAPKTQFNYEYVTEQRLSTWKSKGRRDIIEQGISACSDEDLMELSMLFEEIIHATLDGTLEPAEAGDVVMFILDQNPSSSNPAPSFNPRSIFLDCLSIITEGIDEPGSDQFMSKFITATGVEPSLMRQTLDGKLLQNVSLTRNTFVKVGIRKVTNLLYRQANYNLLREETEGYSKLMTELFTTANQHASSDEVISDLFERVKGLIGTFDLDVGRVLDVTLDVFACLLIKQNRFFVKFLRASSWWPRSQTPGDLGASNYGITSLPGWALPGVEASNSKDEDEAVLKGKKEIRDIAFWNRAREVGLDAFFELGGRRFDADSSSLNGVQGAYSEEDLEWIKLTGTIAPSGNKIAAQLMGFKLRFHVSDSRDAKEVLPANLIYLAALLIKIGFISLRDLYAHLWPLDEAMDAVKAKRMKELEEKERLNRPGGSATNALMMAGALADDTVPRTRESDKVTTAKVDQAAATGADSDADNLVLDPADNSSNQKVMLLVHLLTIGALPESLFILGKFPWLLEAYPEDLLPLIHRILHHSIEKLHTASQPVASEPPSFPPKKYAEPDLTTSAKGKVSLEDAPEKKLLRWPYPDKLDSPGEGKNYVYYWSEWCNNVPVCQTIEDLFTLCATLLNFSGVNIGRDATLLCKLARIGKHSIEQDPSDHNLARWKDLLKRTLVPALSLTKSNSPAVDEVYNMLSHYPVCERFNIYAEWYEGQISRLPAIKAAFANVNRETLATMKRISKTNVTEMARKLAKIAFSSPGIVFQVALNQIEAYSNLIEVVVECGRYFTALGYDVLVWSLLSSLGGKSRSRVQDNGMATSRWLQALALFSGKVFKRYSIMSVTPLLQYVNDQLCRGNSTDLIVLEEITTQMAGIVSDTDFNNAQLEAMTGGDVLRRQTLINLQDKRHESTKTAKRLIKALVDSNLAPQLLISIAQTRQKSAYDIPDEDAHTKLIATLTDETQRILVQFLELLRSNITNDDFDTMVPDVQELMTQYGLEPEFAFLVSRASLSKKIAAALSPKPNGISNGDASVAENVDANGDSVMKEADAATTEASEANDKPLDESAGDLQIVKASDASKSESPPASSGLPGSYEEVLAPIVDAIKEIGPPSRWAVLNPNFYVSFWQLSLTDLVFPMESYNAEMARLRKEQADVMRDRSDMTRAGMNRKEEQKRQLMKIEDDLRAEMSQQIVTYERTKARLMKERLEYFSNCHGQWDVLNEAIIEQCLLPRVLLSPTDAMYCFQMIKFLHSSGTPNFRTLGLLIKIFSAKRLRLLIFQCSIREAENLGRFFKLILSDLSRWHADKALYEKEALGPKGDFPGYAKLMMINGKPKTVLPYEDFRRNLFAIHKSLNTALRECLADSEWTHVRNAITILKGVHEHFPAIDFMGKLFFSALTEIGKREKDKRDDLSLSANALLADLKKREKSWVMTQAFSIGADPNLNRSAIVPSSGSQLKPTAPEFKPRGRASEVEDGEVKDAKSSSGQSTAAPPAAKPAVSIPATRSPAPAAVPEARTESRIKNPPPRSDNVSRTMPPPGRGQQPDLLRNGSTSNGTSSLPARPEPPPRYNDPRSNMGRGGRDTRDGRSNEGRLNNRDHARDFPDPNRRGPDQTHRSFEDRNAPPSRIETLPPQWVGEPSRDGRELVRGGRDKPSSNGTRTPDHKPPRDSAMPPPRSSASHSDRPAANPDRLQMVNAERQEPLHPERAALISGPSESTRPDPSRLQRDDRRERDSRPNSRPPSPRRGSDRSSGIPPNQGSADYRRDEHANTGRSLSTDANGQGRGRLDDSMGSGPARFARNFASNDRLRDSFQHSSGPPRPVDPDHGRLVSSPRPAQPDPNFGRLNGATSDIPSGPRGRDIRSGNRSVSTPQPRGDSMHSAREPIRPPTPEKQPPTGPSSDRSNRGAAARRSLAQVDTTSRGPAAQLPSSTPASPSVHPDRLRHLSNGGNSGPQVPPQQSSGPQMPPQQSQPTPAISQAAVPATSGVHPDRLRQLQADEARRNPPSQPSRNSRIERASVTQAPPPVNTPRGPRSQGLPSPTIGGGQGFAAPTGPADRNTREFRHRPSGPPGPQRHLIAGINSIMQQNSGPLNDRPGAGDRMSIRGHSERMSSANQVTPSKSSAPNTPIAAPRSDLLHARGAAPAVPDIINPGRVDLSSSGRVPSVADDQSSNRSGGGRDHHDRRSRHSRHASRSRSPKRGNPEEDRSTRSSRNSDRRGGPVEVAGAGRDRDARDRERDASGRDRDRDPRRSGRDSDQSRSGAAPPVGNTGRGLGREGDGSRDSIGSGMGASRHERIIRESRGSGAVGPPGGEDPEWSGRRNDMREAERHESRSSRGGDGGSGRKRRGEEQMPRGGDEKRARRG